MHAVNSMKTLNISSSVEMFGIDQAYNMILQFFLHCTEYIKWVLFTEPDKIDVYKFVTKAAGNGNATKIQSK